jgi:hypothetical protein
MRWNTYLFLQDFIDVAYVFDYDGKIWTSTEPYLPNIPRFTKIHMDPVWSPTWMNIDRPYAGFIPTARALLQCDFFASLVFDRRNAPVVRDGNSWFMHRDTYHEWRAVEWMLHQLVDRLQEAAKRKWPSYYLGARQKGDHAGYYLRGDFERR